MGIRKRISGGLRAVKARVKRAIPGEHAPVHAPPSPPPEARPSEARPSEAPPAGTDRPWYLDGENEGWDETNPDPAWRARHGADE